MGFSRQEHWSRLPCPPSGHLPYQETEPMSLMSPALAGGFFTNSATWKVCVCVYIYIYIYICVYVYTHTYLLSNFLHLTPSLYLWFSFSFCLLHTASMILHPWPGIEPMLPAVETRSLNHWITRKVPLHVYLYLPPCPPLSPPYYVSTMNYFTGFNVLCYCCLWAFLNVILSCKIWTRKSSRANKRKGCQETDTVRLCSWGNTGQPLYRTLLPNFSWFWDVIYQLYPPCTKLCTYIIYTYICALYEASEVAQW